MLPENDKSNVFSDEELAELEKAAAQARLMRAALRNDDYDQLEDVFKMVADDYGNEEAEKLLNSLIDGLGSDDEYLGPL